MTIDDFRQSLADPAPPPGIDRALEGLWWDAKGEWDKAHACAQGQHDRDGSWVHAYLHRKEGDQSNASYWYRRAGRQRCESSLDDEWAEIASALLASGA